MIAISPFRLACSNIPAVPAYEFDISYLMQYFRAMDSYQDYLDKGLQSTTKLLTLYLLVIEVIT